MKDADISKLGRYEIVGELGRGAMGVVYKGFDPGIERNVAIKTVRKDLVLDDDLDAATMQIERFKREAKAAGRMTHPNIVAIYEYGEEDNTSYIAMEFVEGQSLKDFFDRNERFDTPTIVRLMTEILAALDYSHRNGIVHRDIKPANIMLTKAGQVKITDFGIARLESSSLTQAGTVLGTPSYMSPEQFMGQTVDARSDLFSAATVFYQFLTGEKPFTGQLTTIMHKVLNSEPEPPSALNVQVPRAFDPVVSVAMAKRPEDRFQTAEEFSRAIQAACDGKRAADSDATMAVGGSSGLAESTVTMGSMDSEATAQISLDSRPASRRGAAPAPDRADPPAKKSNIGLIAAAVAILVIGGGGAAWFLANSGGPSTETEPGHQVEAQRRADAEAEAQRRADAEAEAQRRADAEAEAQRRADAEAEAQRRADAEAEAQRRADAEAEAQRRADAEAEAQRRADAEAEAQRRADAEAEAQRRADAEAEAQRRAEAEQARLAQIETAVDRLDCSLLAVDTSSATAVAVTGYSGLPSPQDTIARTLNDTAPGMQSTISVTAVADAFCGPLDVVRTLRLAGDGIDTAVTMETTPNDGVFANGEYLILNLSAPNYPSYFQVDYYTLEGYVVHLLPNGLEPDNRVAAASQRVLGDPNSGGRFWTIGPPFGKELIVVIASPMPLFPSARPEAEQAAPYLTDLRSAIAAVSNAAGPPVIDARFIMTQQN